MTKIRFFDIDGTICMTSGTDYESATPIEERIKKINALYAKGDKIVYWTSRGKVSGRVYINLTTKQLKSWGCKYHELRFDKPNFDMLYDDRAMNANALDNEEIL